jgi:hypothetical protein
MGFLSRTPGNQADTVKPAAGESIYERLYGQYAPRAVDEYDLWVAKWDPLTGWQRMPAWRPLHKFTPFGQSGEGFSPY